jgi:hypothetical protein
MLPSFSPISPAPTRTGFLFIDVITLHTLLFLLPMGAVARHVLDTVKKWPHPSAS